MSSRLNSHIQCVLAVIGSNELAAYGVTKLGYGNSGQDFFPLWLQYLIQLLPELCGLCGRRWFVTFTAICQARQAKQLCFESLDCVKS